MSNPSEYNSSFTTTKQLASNVKQQQKDLHDIVKQLIDMIKGLQSSTEAATEIAEKSSNLENDCKEKFDEIKVILNRAPATDEINDVIKRARQVTSQQNIPPPPPPGAVPDAVPDAVPSSFVQEEIKKLNTRGGYTYRSGKNKKRKTNKTKKNMKKRKN